MKPTFITPQYASLPKELIPRKIWLRWDYRLVNNKWSKVPQAKSNDPNTWRYLPEVIGHGGDGVGVALGNQLCGIDLDCCRNSDTGEISPWAWSIIELFPDAYIEVSPSRTGLHILFFTSENLDLPGIKHGGKETGWEIAFYAKERYFCMTGMRFDDHAVISEVPAQRVRDFYRNLTVGKFDVTPKVEHSPAERPSNGEAKPNHRFSHLMETGFEGSGYQSPSEADMALCTMLAQGLKAEEIDYVMRHSPLYRDKWDDSRYRDRTIRNAFLYAKKQPVNGAAIIGGRLVGTVMSESRPQQIQWVMAPYFPQGMLVVISGDPSAGKTWIAMWLCAQVTQQGGYVLYFTHENPLEEILIPRFMSLGGDLSHFKHIHGIETEEGGQVQSVSLQDIECIRQHQKDWHKATVIGIDPVQSFFGPKVMMNNASDTRPILDGFGKLAKSEGFCGLLTRHCAKNQQGKAIYRGMGTIDITGAARSELLVWEGPNKQMMMAHVKPLTVRGKTKTYKIEEAKVEYDGELYEAGKFSWGEDSGLSAEDLIEQEATAKEERAEERKRENKLKRAETFLKAKLQDGPVLVDELKREAADIDISFRTLERAKSNLQIEDNKRFGDGLSQWYLRVPLGGDGGVGGVEVN